MHKIRVYRKYPQAVRDRVIKRALEGDKITSELSKELDIPVHLINRWKREYLAEQAAKEEEKPVFNPWTQEETMRDRIALEAMKLMLVADLREPAKLRFGDLASDAYTCADAMMEAGKRRGPLP
jgi:transposase-like protein